VKVKDKDYYGCRNWLPNGAGCEGTIWFPQGFREGNYPNVSFTHKVESKSNPGHFHIVRVYENGDMDCPCVAGQMNKFCDHKEKTIKEVGKLIKILEAQHLGIIG
jgi:hypothetical protein